MQTRSSPSIGVLHSLARVAGLGEYSSESKSVLYGRLKTQYDLQRLERVHDRGLKRLANAADAESDDDADEEVEVANGDSVLSSRRAVRQRSHGSSSSSSPAAARIATASAGTPQRSRRPSAVATTKNSSKSHLQSKLSAEFAAKPAHVLLDPVMLTPLVPGEPTWTFARPCSSHHAAKSSSSSSSSGSTSSSGTFSGKEQLSGKSPCEQACGSKRKKHGKKKAAKKSKGKEAHQLEGGESPLPPPPSSPPAPTLVVYSAASLVDYLLVSGDFCEPETRLPFSEADLASLDAAATGLGKDSVLAAKRDKARYTEQSFRRDALNGLERCAGELVSEMVALIESEEDPEEGQVRLCASLFPPFADLIAQIRAVDPAHAHAALGHFAAFCQGPPNRRTIDRSECLLPVVLNFLRELQVGGNVWFGY